MLLDVLNNWGQTILNAIYARYLTKIVQLMKRNFTNIFHLILWWHGPWYFWWIACFSIWSLSTSQSSSYHLRTTATVAPGRSAASVLAPQRQGSIKDGRTYEQKQERIKRSGRRPYHISFFRSKPYLIMHHCTRSYSVYATMSVESFLHVSFCMCTFSCLHS